MNTKRIPLADLLMAVITVALAAGIPYALWKLAGNPLPTTIPTLTALKTIITSPDDGTTFFTTLTYLGWTSWALFITSILIPRPTATSERTRP